MDHDDILLFDWIKTRTLNSAVIKSKAMGSLINLHPVVVVLKIVSSKPIVNRRSPSKGSYSLYKRVRLVFKWDVFFREDVWSRWQDGVVSVDVCTENSFSPSRRTKHQLTETLRYESSKPHCDTLHTECNDTNIQSKPRSHHTTHAYANHLENNPCSQNSFPWKKGSMNKTTSAPFPNQVCNRLLRPYCSRKSTTKGRTGLIPAKRMLGGTRTSWRDDSFTISVFSHGMIIHAPGYGWFDLHRIVHFFIRPNTLQQEAKWSPRNHLRARYQHWSDSLITTVQRIEFPESAPSTGSSQYYGIGNSGTGTYPI